MRRLALAFLLFATSFAATAADPNKVLRYAFEIAETSFDPPRISDLYSNIVNSAMFDAPLAYDYLARPTKLKPNTAVALPEVSADGATYTLRIKPGIYFNDHPVFKGRKRELTAHDYVYSMKRVLDPKLRASQISEMEPYVLGAEEVVGRARKSGKFDYDAPFDGIKALDRYTFQVKLNRPLFVFVYNFADCRIACAVAREVIEHYGDDAGSNPVGTGPFRLAFWKRSSKIVLEPNPSFREEYFDGEPAADDARANEILQRLKGKRLPMVGRIEISIIEETQPRWLSFLNEEMDILYQLPEEFANQAVPNNKLAPNLAKKGIQMEQVPALDLTFNYFNMNDPVVGGFAAEKVALRRAISLGYKTQDEIAIIRKGQAIPAVTPYAPGVAGWDPNFRTNIGEYNIPKAKALLDMFGYVDRDGDGYRELPDGAPLELKANSTPTARDQQIDELWKRSMDDIGIRISFRKAKWPDLLKEARSNKLQFWQLGGTASSPDADTWLSSLYGKNKENNLARFDHPEYNKAYEAARSMPDSPARTKLYQHMAKIVAAYVPWKTNTHRIRTDMWYPHLIGYYRPLVASTNWWKYVDIDLDVLAQRSGKKAVASK
ncbi:MAG TPA: ABC transporter substrate-binding protein [Usitatibacter sp.]|nr:ABC transporter substrate-binding protein [Usitatibacter sp.]